MALTLGGIRRIRPDWRLLGLLGLTAFYLLPALKTGYYSEDCSHSVGVVGRVILNRCDSLLGVLISDFKGALALGRFFPLTPALIDTVFYLIRDVVLYKAYLITVTLVDLVIFYYLIRRLSGKRDFACFAGCLTVTLFQFRVFIDPLLAYYGQVQLVIACLLVSLMGLDIYLEGRGRRWLVASTGAYLLCTLAYEVTYAFFLLHLLVIVRARRRWLDRLMPALPYIGVAGLCALTTVVVQRLYPSDLYVHKMSFAPGPFLVAMARQPTAALPLSYFLADRHHVFTKFHGFRALFRWVAEPGSIAVALGALALCYACLRRRTVSGRLPVGVGPILCAMAIMLIVLPLPLIASSPSHRQHFSFGVGWIVLLIECFGVGLLVATLIWQCLGQDDRGRLARWNSAIVSIVVAVLMGVTYRANLEVATCFSAPPGSQHFNEFAAMNGASYHRQRLNLEAALDAGLLEDAPTGSTLELANVYPLWHDSRLGKFFYAKHTGKLFHIAAGPGGVASNSRTYRIRDVSVGERAGFVVLSQVGARSSDADQEIRLFVRRPGMRSTSGSPGFSIESDGLAVPRPSTTAHVDRTRPELSLIRAGRDWALFSVNNIDGPMTADSLRPLFDTVEAQRRRRSTTVDPSKIGDFGRLRR